MLDFAMHVFASKIVFDLVNLDIWCLLLFSADKWWQCIFYVRSFTGRS